MFVYQRVITIIGIITTNQMTPGMGTPGTPGAFQFQELPRCWVRWRRHCSHPLEYGGLMALMEHGTLKFVIPSNLI